MGIIDLLNDKNNSLREQREQIWKEQGEVDISPSEWYLISKAYEGEQKISDIVRMSDNSRQAIHKNLQSMQKKSFIKVENIPGNRKEKMVILTSLGKTCYEKDQRIKMRMESEIEENIGSENMKCLKELLEKSWK